MRAPTRRPLRVGDQCLACDKEGVWYAAKVLDERGEGAARELHVHFTGWRGRFDEWVSEARAQQRPKGSVKAALARANWTSTDGHDEASDSWVVERILNKKMARGSLASSRAMSSRSWTAVCQLRQAASQYGFAEVSRHAKRRKEGARTGGELWSPTDGLTAASDVTTDSESQ